LTRFSAGLRRGGGLGGGVSFGGSDFGARAPGPVSANGVERGGVTTEGDSPVPAVAGPAEASAGIGNAIPWPVSRA
jgi:hypothetical protein